MRVAVIFFWVLLSGTCLAQDFAPVGAKWVYTKEYCFSDPYCGYYSITSVRDTIIQTKTVSVLEKEYFGNEVGYDTVFYVYGENKQVFIYDVLSDTFHIFYDFNLAVDDTLVIQDTSLFSTSYYIDQSSHVNFFEVVVDSLDVVQVDGENLVVQYTSPTMHSEAQYLGRNVEKVGNLSHFLGYSSTIVIAGYLGALICYTDNTMYYNPYGANCSVGLAEIRGTPQMLFPNPCKNEIFVSQESEQTRNLVLMDYTGKLVKSFTCFQKVERLDMSTLSQGIYFIEISSHNQTTTIQKIIKL